MKRSTLSVLLAACTPLLACTATHDPATWGYEFSSTKTRAQVDAETREAARLGLLTWRGETPPPRATPEQERLIREAGLRALQNMAGTK